MAYLILSGRRPPCRESRNDLLHALKCGVNPGPDQGQAPRRFGRSDNEFTPTWTGTYFWLGDEFKLRYLKSPAQRSLILVLFGHFQSLLSKQFDIEKQRDPGVSSTTMSLKSALIVVDVQEDFCPPVSFPILPHLTSPHLPSHLISVPT